MRDRKTRRSLTRRALVVSILIAALAGFATALWWRVAEGDVADLNGLPESALSYPGSTLTQTGSRNGSTESSAALFRVWVSAGNVENVVGFYRTELARRGWTEGAGASVIPTVSELRVCGWNKDGVRLRLSFPRARDQGSSASLSIAYEVRLIKTPTVPGAPLCSAGLPE
jgi:hypothetical protein